MSTIDLIKKYRHIFGTDYTQDANCLCALLMDDDTNPVPDASGNSNVGNYDNDPAYNASGKFDGCYDFDGNDALYVEGSGGELDDATGAGQARTWCYWVNFANTTQDNKIVTDKSNFAGKHFWCEIQSESSYLNIYGGVSTTNGLNTGNSLEASTWYHIALTYDGTNTTLYLDGSVVDGPQAQTAPDDTIYDMWLMNYPASGAGATGFMDEFAIFSRALSSVEINAIMDNGLVGGGTEKDLSDTETITDKISKDATTIKSDTSDISDAILKDSAKIKADAYALTDFILKNIAIVKADGHVITDTVLKNIEKKLVDVFSITDAIEKTHTAGIQSFEKEHSDIANINDALKKDLSRVFSDGGSITEYLLKFIGKIPTDTFSISDVIASESSLNTKQYTRGDLSSLPADDTDLEYGFSASDFISVGTSDDVRLAQTGTSNEYMIFQFKDRGDDNTQSINPSWEGSTNVAPASSMVYLQIYDHASGSWLNLASNNTANKDEDFVLSAQQANGLSNFYGSNYFVSCRIYQQST